jgi:hypothetical protein
MEFFDNLFGFFEVIRRNTDFETVVLRKFAFGLVMLIDAKRDVGGSETAAQVHAVGLVMAGPGSNKRAFGRAERRGEMLDEIDIAIGAAKDRRAIFGFADGAEHLATL